MRDKEAEIMMEGMYKEVDDQGRPERMHGKQNFMHGQPENRPDLGTGDSSDADKGEEWYGRRRASKLQLHVRSEVEKYLSAQPEVQAGVLAILDKYYGPDPESIPSSRDYSDRAMRNPNTPYPSA